MTQTSTPPLVRALLRPEAYPGHPRAVQLVETHISYLFLTGQHVYKVKKPVNFGFLDFSTLEKRQFFCQQEVELNRRLSSNVYLGVVEIRQEGDRYSVDGPGTVVEYAVQMRQLPSDRLMRHLLQRGQLTEEMVRRVAQKIAAFHQESYTNPRIASLGGYQAVVQNVTENFEQTREYIGQTISRETYEDLKAYSEAFLEARQPLFLARERDGWIRDCHGDLHTAQIFLENGIQVIDCIEFNERFRYSDTIADMAFLAMDLDYHRSPGLSAALVDEYQRIMKDPGLPIFLDFYKVYRAYVRGKVTGFRLQEAAAPSEEKELAREVAGSYYHLAQSYLGPLRSPVLYVTSGMMGSGKSRLAEELGRRWAIQVISSDLVRKELAGIPPQEHRYEPFEKGIYSPEFTLRTYKEMLSRASALISRGSSVILDASFNKASLRGEALRVAEALRVPVVFIECTAPEPVLQERLERRAGRPDVVSDGRWEIYHQQKTAFEPLSDVPTDKHLTVDTSGPAAETVFKAMKGVYALRLKGQKE